MKMQVQRDEWHDYGLQMLDDEGRREEAAEQRTNLWARVVSISIMERAI
jgi:hypothetical protein